MGWDDYVEIAFLIGIGLFSGYMIIGDLTLEHDMYWIVEKRDDAIMGFVNGVQSQQTVAGPFDSYDKALEVKTQGYQRFGSRYYTVVENSSEPKSRTNEYEFVDADREFDDCY
jgi:hypothetical protein